MVSSPLLQTYNLLKKMNKNAQISLHSGEPNLFKMGFYVNSDIFPCAFLFPVPGIF